MLQRNSNNIFITQSAHIRILSRGNARRVFNFLAYLQNLRKIRANKTKTTYVIQTSVMALLMTEIANRPSDWRTPSNLKKKLL